MSPPLLKDRVRNATILLLLLLSAVSVFSVTRLYRLGGAIRETLYRNYRSIEAAQQMHAALRLLQLAERDGHGREALAAYRQAFAQANDLEQANITEPGEAEIEQDIDRRAQTLFDQIASAPQTVRHDSDLEQLHSRVDDLIQINKAAMFQADSHAFNLARRLAYEFGAEMIVALLAAAALSLRIGLAVLNPLGDLAEALQSVSQRKSPGRLGTQKFAELDAVAHEFNHMADRLEEYEKVSVERLMYEKTKTEKIIEGLGDGIILLNPERVVSHINETATLILGIDRNEALGSPFDDLSSNNPHYLKIRSALQTLRKLSSDQQQIEVELHFRGRDHFYMLKRVPLKGEDQPLGVLLILQDVTYLRDREASRAHLLTMLSRDLQEPLTAMALSAERLARDGGPMTDNQRQAMEEIRQDCARLKQLADNLTALARSESE
jgi:NtrC-family two-component system sensor histidine kinase KinB